MKAKEYVQMAKDMVAQGHRPMFILGKVASAMKNEAVDLIKARKIQTRESGLVVHKEVNLKWQTFSRMILQIKELNQSANPTMYQERYM